MACCQSNIDLLDCPNTRWRGSEREQQGQASLHPHSRLFSRAENVFSDLGWTCCPGGDWIREGSTRKRFHVSVWWWMILYRVCVCMFIHMSKAMFLGLVGMMWRLKPTHKGVCVRLSPQTDRIHFGMNYFIIRLEIIVMFTVFDLQCIWLSQYLRRV